VSQGGGRVWAHPWSVVLPWIGRSRRVQRSGSTSWRTTRAAGRKRAARGYKSIVFRCCLPHARPAPARSAGAGESFMRVLRSTQYGHARPSASSRRRQMRPLSTRLHVYGSTPRTGARGGAVEGEARTAEGGVPRIACLPHTRDAPDGCIPSVGQPPSRPGLMNLY
jgi:hypothetical protein